MNQPMQRRHETTPELQTSWRVGWRTVTLRVSALRDRNGRPVFEIHWVPSQPDKLRGPDIADYDHGYRNAKATLTAQLASLQRST